MVIEVTNAITTVPITYLQPIKPRNIFGLVPDYTVHLSHIPTTLLVPRPEDLDTS